MRDGVLKKPILVDANALVILDGIISMLLYIGMLLYMLLSVERML